MFFKKLLFYNFNDFQNYFIKKIKLSLEKDFSYNIEKLKKTSKEYLLRN